MLKRQKQNFLTGTGFSRKQSDDRQSIAVNGTVDLRGHPFGRKTEVIPSCTIFGDLYADGDCSLRACQCVVIGDVVLDDSLIEEFSGLDASIWTRPEVLVTGGFSAKRCQNLKTLSGKFGAWVNLSESGVEKLDETFFCAGELSVAKCARLDRLDCSAWSIVADGSALTSTGPNTTAECFSAADCPNLRIAGRIQDLKSANYDGSGVTQVSTNFSCGVDASFLRCRRLEKLSGKFLTLEVGGSALRQVSDLSCRDILFIGCDQLPERMSHFHARSVDFLDCGIFELPKGLPERADLRLLQCPNFSRLPRRVKGNLELCDLPQLKEIPNFFQCAGTVGVERCEGLEAVGGEIKGDLEIRSGSERLTQRANENNNSAKSMRRTGCPK